MAAKQGAPNSDDDALVVPGHFLVFITVEQDVNKSGDGCGDESRRDGCEDESRTFNQRSAEILAIQKSGKVPEAAQDGIVFCTHRPSVSINNLLNFSFIQPIPL